ncbi:MULTISPECIES: conjugal transfer protein TraH [Neisseria]|uniref:conjugal transfer protein TraH n=1 Tax=Neisseria TaxID=482 RepID=UPI0025F0BF7E|nr:MULTISPECIES: conjugal transfer protein TraH [Neisseria]
MKLHVLGIFIAVLLVACGQSEEEKFYQQMNKDRELSEINKKRNSCIRQNRINNTNIDCDKKYPRPEK